jgi:selenide,water dikinase
MIKIMELSTGGGCGCKAPEEALSTVMAALNANALNGEDAAIVGIPNSMKSLVSSIDFIQPIINCEYRYGMIAALHAFNDLFAKGVAPKGASVILCWPRELIGTKGAVEVMRGIQAACSAHGVEIWGGHSIDSQNPIVGLSVIGFSDRGKITPTMGGKDGDLIFITKSLGVGLACNSLNRNQLSASSEELLMKVLLGDNRIGIKLVNDKLVTSMTDVTGYGLSKQISKMVGDSGLIANIDFQSIPFLSFLHRVDLEELETRLGKNNRETSTLTAPDNKTDILINDPQTNGPLLFTAPVENVDRIMALREVFGCEITKIGSLNRDQP